MRFANLHSIGRMWNTSFDPGPSFFKKSTHLSLAYDVIQLFSALNCTQPLGMEDESISDGQISASSERKRHFGPANARLNFSGDDTRAGAWMPRRNDSSQWLQVDFGNETRVTGIDTQGRRCRICHQWVKEYTVSYSRDNVTFHKYKQDGNVKVFFDNFSISTIQDIQGHFGPNSCASYVFFLSLLSPNQRNSRPTPTETPSSVTRWVPPLWRGTSASILQTAAVPTPWGWSSGVVEQVWASSLPFSVSDEFSPVSAPAPTHLVSVDW